MGVEQIYARLLCPCDPLAVQHAAQACVRVRVRHIGQLIELKRIVVGADLVAIVRAVGSDSVSPAGVRVRGRLEIYGFAALQLCGLENVSNQQCGSPP